MRPPCLHLHPCHDCSLHSKCHLRRADLLHGISVAAMVEGLGLRFQLGLGSEASRGVLQCYEFRVV